jgi:selenocysteine lyase/cysteine desulfurase
MAEWRTFRNDTRDECASVFNLHHNFVVALLNDLFGIQSRGGCSCAGSFGHRLDRQTWTARTRSTAKSLTVVRASSPAGPR